MIHLLHFLVLAATTIVLYISIEPCLILVLFLMPIQTFILLGYTLYI